MSEQQQLSLWLLTLGLWWVWFESSLTLRETILSGCLLGAWTSGLFVFH